MKKVFGIITILVLTCLGAIAQEIKGGVVNGKAISLPKPDYPAAARKARVSGPVSVQVLIGEDGNVISAKAIVPTGETAPDDKEAIREFLYEAAERAAAGAKFAPTMLSGVPVKVSGVIVYNFVGSSQKMPGTISGGVLNGKAIALPAAEFPTDALASNISGIVHVRVLIDENGDVATANAESGHPLLRPSAEVAARGAKFAPTLLGGVPVQVSGLLIIKFGIPGQSGSRGQMETPKTISVLNGRALSLPLPIYPDSAREAKAGGGVNVQVTVDEMGNVIAANSVSGHPLLRAAAEEAARNAKFRVAEVDGVPVKVNGIIYYNFVP
ncbi:MAG: TonB family protein [Pyrinomonadaceae bacterium]